MTMMMARYRGFHQQALDRRRSGDRLLQEAGLRSRRRDRAALDLRRARARLMQTYDGSCHCGRVRFRVTAALDKVVRCNCSICTKKGFLHLIVPLAQFELAVRRRRPDRLHVQHRRREAPVLPPLRHPPVLRAALRPRQDRRQRALPGRRRPGRARIEPVRRCQLGAGHRPRRRGTRRLPATPHEGPGHRIRGHGRAPVCATSCGGGGTWCAGLDRRADAGPRRRQWSPTSPTAAAVRAATARHGRGRSPRGAAARARRFSELVGPNVVGLYNVMDAARDECGEAGRAGQLDDGGVGAGKALTPPASRRASACPTTTMR